MKKIFSLFATASVALLGLTCCGGGGGGSSDDGYMTIEDFARGAKMFRIYNRVVLEIQPDTVEGVGKVTSESTQVTCTCTFISGSRSLGKDGTASVTYTRGTEDHTYTMDYSFHSSEILQEEDVILSFGFTPLTQTSNGDTFQMPDSIGSLGSIEMQTTLDMDSHQCITRGYYQAVDAETGLVLEEKGTIKGQMKPFIVIPKG